MKKCRYVSLLSSDEPLEEIPLSEYPLAEMYASSITASCENQYFDEIEAISPGLLSSDSRTNVNNGTTAKNTTNISTNTAIIHLPILPRLILLI